MSDDGIVERKRRLDETAKPDLELHPHREDSVDSVGSNEPAPKKPDTEKDEETEGFQLQIELQYLRIYQTEMMSFDKRLTRLFAGGYDELQEIMTIHLRDGDAVCPVGIFDLEVLSGAVLTFGSLQLSINSPRRIYNLPNCSRYNLGTLIRSRISSSDDDSASEGSVIRLKYVQVDVFSVKSMVDCVSELKRSFELLESCVGVDEAAVVRVATCDAYAQVPRDYYGLGLFLERVEVANRKKSSLQAISSTDLRPRILVCGDKDIGKSYCVRYLVNSLLNVYPYVFLLDCDCGQSEFSPHGFVSLFKLEEPVFGAPWLHLRDPILSFFVGSPSPAQQPSMYARFAKTLAIRMDEIDQSNCPLIVNYMGWMDRQGLYFLKNTINGTRPSLVVQLFSDSKNSSIRPITPSRIQSLCEPNEQIHADFDTLAVKSPFHSKNQFRPKRSIAKTMRMLALASYFCLRQRRPLRRIQFDLGPLSVLLMFNEVDASFTRDEIVHGIVVFGKSERIYPKEDAVLLLQSGTRVSKVHSDDNVASCGLGIVEQVDEDDANSVKMTIVTPVTEQDLANFRFNSFCFGKYDDVPYSWNEKICKSIKTSDLTIGTCYRVL